tara:strand:+ start:121 stop:294 length:174 start_codon:yes stop_codon:yes gene_type:complete
MDVINQGNLFKILKASQVRRNENAEGDRKREVAKDKYVRYFSKIFAGSSGEKTSESK